VKRGGPLKQKAPLKPGKGFAPRSAPMNRGTSTLTTKAPMKRASAPMKAHKSVKDKPKRAARNAGPIDYLALCRGQPCYLLVPGVAHHPPDTVVPCHSNQQQHGKGMGIKALDIYTVPGCLYCHHELDQGRTLDKAARREIWEAAYVRWEIARALLLGVGDRSTLEAP
jgi:hypothetical protein